MTNSNFYLYGPPGSGKSSLGRALADVLHLPFLDLDENIAREAGMSIPEIFEQEGEAGFRRRELHALGAAVDEEERVISLGGGALLDPRMRRIAEQSGQVLCLLAEFESLLERLESSPVDRPLLAGNTREQLARLMEERDEHYRSFSLRLGVDGKDLGELLWQAQQKLGAFRVSGMGPAYDVRIEPEGLCRLGECLLARGLKGPIAVVTDQTVARHHLKPVLDSLRAAGYQADSFSIEPGEEHKTIATVLAIWDFLARVGIERGSTVIALGGGVVGDLTGFAAATFLRGVAWVNLPTTLLAMVDSSLGGKTGIDLPQAKNLVGAFYPPRLVFTDPVVLETLPERELRNGLAEVIKHGIIADPELFDRCAAGWEEVTDSLDWIVRRAMAVKLKVIEIDPYEKGPRQALNLGHTIGHGLEMASNFLLTHGEAVAIGMVAEAQLAEGVNLAEPDLVDKIAGVIAQLGLPTKIPAGLNLQQVVTAMLLDKKRSAGKIRFALPVQIGEVRTGVTLDGWQEMILAGGA